MFLNSPSSSISTTRTTVLLNSKPDLPPSPRSTSASSASSPSPATAASDSTAVPLNVSLARRYRLQHSSSGTRQRDDFTKALRSRALSITNHPRSGHFPEIGNRCRRRSSLNAAGFEGAREHQSAGALKIQNGEMRQCPDKHQTPAICRTRYHHCSRHLGWYAMLFFGPDEVGSRCRQHAQQ